MQLAKIKFIRKLKVRIIKTIFLISIFLCNASLASEVNYYIADGNGFVSSFIDEAIGTFQGVGDEFCDSYFRAFNPSGVGSPDLPQIFNGNRNSLGNAYICESLSGSGGTQPFNINQFLCPEPTIGHLPYDIEGCGCLNPSLSSSFDGILGGPEGCALPPPEIEEKDNPNCNITGQPCHIPTGAKYRNEVDYSDSPMSFRRYYHSFNLTDNGLGKGWHNQYLKGLIVSPQKLAVIEDNGRSQTWNKIDGFWQGDADSDYKVLETATGLNVIDQFNITTEYSSDGRILKRTDAQNRFTTYIYDDESRLESVANQYGLALSFEYSIDGKNHITKVVDSTGVEYGYEYDESDNLVAVIYPDTNSDESDNPRKIYHYENVDFPNHLTGITDQKGDRYATFEYDSDGKAILSELGQTTNSVGQRRMQLSY